MDFIPLSCLCRESNNEPKGEEVKMCRKEMDPECIELCKILNQIPGIKTRSSCCGHGESPYWILFDLDTDRDAIAYVLCCLWEKDWFIQLKYVIDEKPKYYFELLGPIGERAFKDSLFLAERIEKYLIV